VLHAVERLHHALARRVGARPAYAFREDLGADERLERREGEILLAEGFLDRRLVLPDDLDRGPRIGRNVLRDDDARALVTELGRERAGADEGRARELRARPGFSRALDEVAGGLVKRCRDDDVGGGLDDLRHGGTEVGLISLQGTDRRG